MYLSFLFTFVRCRICFQELIFIYVVVCFKQKSLSDLGSFFRFHPLFWVNLFTRYTVSGGPFIP